MSSDGLTQSPTKKRRADTDISIEEEAMAPARKQLVFAHPEEVTHELETMEDPHPAPKRPPRASREVKRLGKERIVEIMKSICFACLQISAHLDLESKKSNESIPLLSSLVGDITRAVEDTSRYIPYDTLIAILDGLKRRAIGSINPDFFAMAVTAEFASALLHHELMETWLNNTFTFNTELSREEIVGCRCVRDLFIMVLERATSPDEVHTLPAILTAVVPDVEGEIVGIGEECTGITSNSIITGFKSFPMDSIKGSDDVSYEERQNIDGTIVSTLRAVECQRKRSRGSICEACRLAQNRWAVRICRQKKAKPDANGAAIAQ